MREIKFRAWDKHIGEMIYCDPLHLGDYLCDKDNVMMQFTGLLDKHGKEVYESDYLGDWCVFWGSGKYILQNISSGDIMDCNEKNTNNKEVTGNRFETPREHPAMATDLQGINR